MARLPERTLFAGALAAIGAAVLLSWWLLLGRGPAVEPPRRVPPAGPAATRVQVARTEGEAWLTRAGGPRVRLAVGTVLEESDAIETSEGSVVELGSGEGFRVSLDGSARFDVKEIAAELARFRLEEGFAEAKVKPGVGQVLVIESSDDASVQTAGGRVSVAAGNGRVAVGVSEGEARLGSGGQIVAVQVGQFSVAEKGKAPTTPVPLPRSLLLKVDWPTGKETNRPRMVVRGRTTPGALVSLGGERVDVGADGAFTHTLFLREGQQTIEASARDVAGRREHSRSRPVVLDTRAPDTKFDTNDLWGKRRQQTTTDKK